MNVFDLRDRLVDDYAHYTKSFIKIQDPLIQEKVNTELNAGAFWPDPMLQLNPTFESGGTVEDLVREKVLHPQCSSIFRIGKSAAHPAGERLYLHAHQRAAVLKAREGKSYVLTSGTGSGKSLTYILPIVDHVLRTGSGHGVQAVVVYPMNALANSQSEELKKFLENGFAPGNSPVRFARYTGQEKGLEREEIRSHPPDILLTNYMMLELLLTRNEDRELVRAMQGLRFLVFDELHTYRGRQGADVALLIRRCRMAFGGHEILCVGTSATMASEGNTEEQKEAVAQVARTFFGVPFDSSQVIGETLRRSTPEIDYRHPEVVRQLRQTIEENLHPPADCESFLRHPLASWIESTFGIRSEEGTGRLVRQSPRRLEGEGSAASELARLTGTDAATQCSPVLRRFLIQGSGMYLSPNSRYPLFAFRLHQFFTRGDTVWSTLEPSSVRHLELSKQVCKPGEPEKILFPMVFCRQCGTAYYRVKLVEKKPRRFLLPREDKREEILENQTDAYLYVSESAPWPQGKGSEMLSRLPEEMKEISPQGEERVSADYRRDIPEVVFVDPGGNLVPEGQGVAAALIHGNFQFCLDPKCGIFHARTQRSERSKLLTLGVDNRSTATTILAIRSLIELQGDPDLSKEASKLLSFTDNRQDASLQAGHFNDFAQVALLRSALHRAMETKGPAGLTHGELSREVFAAMKLSFEDYAADPGVRGPAKNTTQEAFRRVLDYFLYRDLERGWRVTAPNLEDCGLLTFDYEGLQGPDGLLEDKEIWGSGLSDRSSRRQETFVETPAALRACPPEIRQELLLTLLDVLRRKLAVKVDVLDPLKQLDLVEQTRSRLREDTVWYLPDTRDLSKAEVAYPRPKKPRENTGFFIASRGGYGKYLKRTLAEYAPPHQGFKGDEVNRCIRFLFLALKCYGILQQMRDGDDPGYQINEAALRWVPGTGDIRPLDHTRLLRSGEIPPEANRYFVDCYRRFLDLKCLLEAREHTAQVAAEDRQEREDRFRSGDLPLLFCSPTMELGVDIAQLNLVNLRNVPPTPANYAQRSGRAGRGGQPALVYTYCAGRSPHDQYYFHRPDQMVSGSVAPPRIDLRNQDLLRSHIHALWMGCALPDLGTTLTTVLDLTRQDDRLPLTVKPALQQALKYLPHRALALDRAQRLLGDMAEELKGAVWLHADWAKEALEQIERAFDAACERWRSLYRAAVRQRELHHKILGDHSRPESERDQSRRLRAQAESQIRLLTEAEGVYEGDFYSYRYFAAEGFLPGYNFPRLPVSAYVPERRRRANRDDFISRPRFLAISEFGPRSLIYHEGTRYRVCKVNLDFGSDDIEATHQLATAVMKRCTRCGYAHLEQGERNLTEICERCGEPFENEARIDKLIQQQNVTLRAAQHITCDEEERKRYGYRVVTSYRFPEIGGRLDRKDAEVYCDDTLRMRLSYGDTTDLYRINLGWAARKGNQPTGFFLDLERGFWARNQADEEDMDDVSSQARIQQVVPYVKDTKNALVLRLEPACSPAETASLAAAFKEAIQKYFQLESRELACESMPDADRRREILFYEASEGGAGILRQMVEDPRVIPALARCALDICHFDPITLEDHAAQTCGKACYRCLLDYGNQPDHKELDRFLIRDLLSDLARSDCRPSGGTGGRAERIQALRKRCDSQLEKKWLDLVDELNMYPPGDGQYLIESCRTRPDFYYPGHHAAIYIDGPPHDDADQKREDAEIDRRLLEAGYIVIRFPHQADWKEIFRRHPDLFGGHRP